VDPTLEEQEKRARGKRGANTPTCGISNQPAATRLAAFIEWKWRQ
jgi:hypothetical protein